MAFILLAIVLVLIGIWLKLRHRNGYWQRQGVPFIPGTAFLGNMTEACTFSKPMVTVLKDLYESPIAQESAAVGIHIFTRSALMVRDLDLVKAVLVKDFVSFNNR